MIDRMAILRAGFLTTRACGPDGIYELKIKFQSLEDLDAADQELRDALEREKAHEGPLVGEQVPVNQFATNLDGQSGETSAIVAAATPFPKEREAFEAHADSRALRLDRDDGEGYRYIQTDEAWGAWQARAALTSACKQEGGEPIKCRAALLPSGWVCDGRQCGNCTRNAAPQPPLAGAGEALDAARWRRLVNASELPFPVAAIADDPENDQLMVYGRKRLEQFIDSLDEISDEYQSAALNPKPAPLNGGCGDGESE